MCAIYAFMRYCDDLSEGEGRDRATAIAALARRSGSSRSAGQSGDHPAVAGFHRYRRSATASRTSISIEMIDGVSSDLEPRQVQNFRRAVRLLLSRRQRGGSHHHSHLRLRFAAKRLELAEKCGIAFQLTNILRDVREDQQNGRVYIPLEDIRKFGADLATHDERFVRLMRFEAERARAYYDESRPLIALVHPRSRPSLWALIEIYRRLLARIERSNFDVLEKRIRVPTWEKLSILASAALR